MTDRNENEPGWVSHPRTPFEPNAEQRALLERWAKDADRKARERLEAYRTELDSR